MRELLARLDDPHLGVKTLHVAGTKGKGSTCALAESVLRAAGMRTGLTTSPHLCTARERIVVDGAMIDERAFASLEERVREHADALAASFFERIVAMAWLAFADARVDVAVVEVGLGGRLDATNVCAPSACAITRLGLDHTEHLGPTLKDIAREKAGILKRAVPAVSSPQSAEGRAVLVEAARRVGAPLRFVDTDDTLAPSLAGAHQRENASVALALLDASGLGARIDVATRARGLAAARWPGRYETVGSEPLVVVDGAHNETAAHALSETVQSDARIAAGCIALIIGMTQGRDARAFAEALRPLAPSRTWVVAPRSPRARDPVALADEVRPALDPAGEGRVEMAPSVAAALAAAREHAGHGGAVIVCGSLYLVGEVRHALLGGPMDEGVPTF